MSKTDFEKLVETVKNLVIYKVVHKNGMIDYIHSSGVYSNEQVIEKYAEIEHYQIEEIESVELIKEIPMVNYDFLEIDFIDRVKEPYKQRGSLDLYVINTPHEPIQKRHHYMALSGIQALHQIEHDGFNVKDNSYYIKAVSGWI